MHAQTLLSGVVKSGASNRARGRLLADALSEMSKADRATLPSLAPTCASARVPALLRARHVPEGSVEAAVVAWIDGQSDLSWIAHKTALSVAEVTAIGPGVSVIPTLFVMTTLCSEPVPPAATVP